MIGDEPFVPVFRQDRDPIAGLDSQLDQSRCHPVGLPAIVCPVQVLISAPALEAQGDIRPAAPAGFAMERSEILRHEMNSSFPSSAWERTDRSSASMGDGEPEHRSTPNLT